MREERKIVLDFSQMGSIGEIHEMLKAEFGFPDYYGRNWDALNDCLGDFLTDGGKCAVEVRGLDRMDEQLRKKCAPMLEVFEEIQSEHPGVNFSVEF